MMLLERLMRVLTPRERLVLTLRFHDDLTQAEIDFFTYSAAQYVQLKNEYL